MKILGKGPLRFIFSGAIITFSVHAATPASEEYVNAKIAILQANNCS